MEKYFQIARCFRDEDLRADRQPEFTQLDIEMSFTNEQTIQTFIEEMLAHVYKKIFNKKLAIPFERMSYDDAILHYGSDKPDLRFELKIQSISSLFGQTELKFLRSVLDKGGKVGALHVEKYNFSRSDFEKWVKRAQELVPKGLFIFISMNPAKLNRLLPNFYHKTLSNKHNN